MPSRTDTPTDPPLLRVSGPTELAQAIPYLLGFHPARSLVVVGLRERRVVVTARVDLEDVASVTETGDKDATSLLAETFAAMLDSGVARLVAIVYDDAAVVRGSAPVDLPWTAVADRVQFVAALVGLEVDEVALVSRGRLWSYECDDPRCCPPDGRPIEPDSTVAATAAYAGMVALPDRASLAALLARRVDPALLPARSAELVAAERAADDDSVGDDPAVRTRSEVRALFAAARNFDKPGSTGSLGDDDRLRFAVALRRIAVRDAVWVGVDDRRIDGRALWRELATNLPAPYDAPPLFLFAWASYRAGDGALARIAAERALDSDPACLPANMVLGALAQALDPRRLPQLRRHDKRDDATAERRGVARGEAGRRPR